MSASEPPAPQDSEAGLADKIDQPVTLVGVARDAKAGAVLVLPSAGPIYISGLSSWPSSEIGNEIEAKGILRHIKYIPDPIRTPGGAIGQGASGLQFVLEDAVWHRC